MPMKLCNLNPNIFRANASENGGSLVRAEIVAAGRLLSVESAGRDLNALRLLESRSAEYTPMLDSTTYATTNKNVLAKMHLFAAKCSAAQNGEEAPTSFEEIQRNQRKYLSDPAYLRVLSGILRDIATPVGATVLSNALDWLCQIVPVPIGGTYQVDVQSNDIFTFEDDSFGASASKPRNHSYVKSITLNPTLRTAAASIKWYQLIGNEADLGRLMNSMTSGYYSKVVALWNKAMEKGAASTVFTPAALTFETYNSSNWTKAIKRTAMANGTSRKNITAFGDIAALSKILPAGNSNAASVNLDAALAVMLGAEWTKYGYIGEVGGARLMPIDNVVIPGTQNSTLTEMLKDTTIFFAANNGTKPVYLGIEEGGPFEISLSPGQTADMTIDIQLGICMAAVPVFASKIGVMRGV